jgi:hypothetical protein
MRLTSSIRSNPTCFDLFYNGLREFIKQACGLHARVCKPPGRTGSGSTCIAPAQSVDATLLNQLVRQYFPLENPCALPQSIKSSQGSVQSESALANDFSALETTASRLRFSVASTRLNRRTNQDLSRFEHSVLPEACGFASCSSTLWNETRNASSHHFIQSLPGLNSIDFVKRVFRKS